MSSGAESLISTCFAGNRECIPMSMVNGEHKALNASLWGLWGHCINCETVSLCYEL